MCPDARNSTISHSKRPTGRLQKNPRLFEKAHYFSELYKRRVLTVEQSVALDCLRNSQEFPTRSQAARPPSQPRERQALWLDQHSQTSPLPQPRRPLLSGPTSCLSLLLMAHWSGQRVRAPWPVCREWPLGMGMGFRCPHLGYLLPGIVLDLTEGLGLTKCPKTMSVPTQCPSGF